MHLAVPHLSRIGQSYYLRITVPHDLRRCVGCREVKRSLGTTSTQEALHQVKPMSEAVWALFRLMRRKPQAMVDPQRVKQLIDRVVRDRFKADLHWYEQFRLERGAVPAAQLEGELQDAEERLERLKGELARGDFQTQANIASFVKTYYGEEDARLVDEPGVLDKLCREVQKARITEAQIELERAKGNYDNQFDEFSNTLIESVKEPAGRQASGNPPAGETHTLGELRDKYLREHETGGKWSEKTKVTVRGVFDELTEVLGEQTPVTAIRRSDIVGFRETVQKLPANRTKGRYKGKSIESILGMPDVEPMGYYSVRTRLTWTSGFFRWCVEQDYMQKNPADRLVPPKPNRPQSDERDPFNRADLERLILALAARRAEKPRRPEQFWIPLIALYSGMRLNEICQLYCNDVKQVEGVWCLDVNQSTKDKRLKSPAAARTVPVHPKLIELGFLDYIKAMQAKGEKRLWPNLKLQRDGYGQAFSKWFADFNDKNVVNDPKKVFHSFRHTVANTLKQAGVQESTIAELIGHENESITTGRYGKLLKPGPLLDAIEKLDYGLDLSPLGVAAPKAAEDDDPT
jgi:integrase